MDQTCIETYCQILRQELVPAMGCTEPIAVAYAAALARETLGALPEKVELRASGNIIKNVKSVVVPNTGGLEGLEAAVAAGLAAGKAELQLQVLSQVTPEQQDGIRAFLDRNAIQVLPADTDQLFDILLTLEGGGHTARVRIAGYHTNVVLVEKDGAVLTEKPVAPVGTAKEGFDRLNVKDILDFAKNADLAPITDLLERQIEMNSAISRAGLTQSWGACIGRTLLDMHGEDVMVRAKAAAAAGSDARMSGCELPVVIVSGSGNQGMTASLPVITFAQHLGKSHQELLRALTLSDLLTLHLKSGIGPLSAYCGAVCAGCSAGAAIAWLHGGDYEAVTQTLSNGLAIVSGIVCDGAKPSCAAKIASAVEAGLMGWQMYLHGHSFHPGEGIVGECIEETIRNVGRLGREGMKETDREILRIMTGC